MTKGGTVFGKPAKPKPPGLVDRLRALRHRPKTLAALAVVLLAAGWAWANRGAETWITAAPAEISVAVGASQELTVALMYKPRFRLRRNARSIAGTIQLISFPQAVDVTPTTVVTTEASPQAVMKVTGVRAGGEELDLAASNRPADQRSWRTGSVRVVVTR